MSDPRALYQALIVEHDRHPRHHGPLAEATAHATVDNPLCGDEVAVHLRREGEQIEAISFEARGCALCRAAGSMMCARAAGQDAAALRALAARFAAYVKTPAAVDAPATVPDEHDDEHDLGDLTAFVGVRAFRSRQACATLPFRALLAALDRG